MPARGAATRGLPCQLLVPFAQDPFDVVMKPPRHISEAVTVIS
jgi:hypothetical protein